MAFIPDSSASYSNYKAQIATVAGADRGEFVEHVIKYLCQKADGVSSITASDVTAAGVAAKASIKAARHTY
jgi:hypothetical protein